MRPDLLFQFIAIALIVGGFGYLVFRAVVNTIVARYDQQNRLPAPSAQEESSRYLVDICDSLGQRMERLEQRQDFLETLLERRETHSLPAQAPRG